MLIKHGYSVYHSSVSWAANVKERAEELRKNLQVVLAKTDVEKVNIVAHSMGGLDARHMLFNDRDKGRIHEKVASLTTIGTPHLGTSFADKGIQEHGYIIEILEKLSLNIDGVRDLTRNACAAFNDNPEVKAFEDELEKHTELRAYTGSARLDNVLSILRKPYRIIREEEGDNDGLVSVDSALWKRAKHTGIWKDTDHLNEIGWWDFEQAATEGISDLTERIHKEYLEIARELPGRR